MRLSQGHVIDRRRLYDRRIKIRRAMSKEFDEKYRRKRSQSQVKWRLSKWQQQQQLDSLPSTELAIPTAPRKNDLRKSEGLKRRRQHLSNLNAQLEDLHQTVHQLSSEIEGCHATGVEIERTICHNTGLYLKL